MSDQSAPFDIEAATEHNRRLEQWIRDALPLVKETTRKCPKWEHPFRGLHDPWGAHGLLEQATKLGFC